MAILPIKSWSKTVYIAKLISTNKDSYGNQTNVYDTPIQFTLNVQPLSDSARIEIFGANAKKMYVALSKDISIDINDFDLVYLEDATPTGETKNGFNANYVVRRASIQNIVGIYYFESIKGR